MHNRILRGLIVAGTLFTSVASAQIFRDRYGRPSDGYYGNQEYGYGRGGDVVTRTLEDLRRLAYSGGGYGGYGNDSREQKRLREAEKELLKFVDRSRNGRFDDNSLGDAIEEMEKAVNSNRLHPQAREILARDIYALRAFRSSGGRDYDPYSRGRTNDPYYGDRRYDPYYRR
jgi:hypothetical protein